MVGASAWTVNELQGQSLVLASHVHSPHFSRFSLNRMVSKLWLRCLLSGESDAHDLLPELADDAADGF